MNRPLLSFRPIAALFAGACALLSAAPSEAQRWKPVLVPEPAQVSAVDGPATLGPYWAVRVPASSPADSFAATLLIEDVKTRFGWRWTIEDGTGPAVVLRPLRRSLRATELWNHQGYELEVWPDSIVIRAPTEAGRYYGVQTLRQIVRGMPGTTVPGLVIRDGPQFEWRGLSDDISRGQMSTIEDFKRTVAALGFYKANTYELYIEDVFEFPGAPGIGRGRSRLTPAELTAIVEEGRRHHVNVIPIFETLGHQQRLLKQPELNRFAEVQAVHTSPWRWNTVGAKLGYLVQTLFFGATDEETPAPWSFSPALEESRAFVKERINELLQAAPGAWFHIGGDEAFDVGRGLSDAPSGPRRGRLLADYFTDLADHLRRQRRQTMVYADELLADSTGLQHVPRDVTMVYWNYRGDGADSALFALRGAGFAHVHVSPGLWDWSTFAPHSSRAFPAIAEMVASGAEARAEGVVVASWGDGGAEGHKVLSWPGIAYAADAGWFGAADSALFFLPRFATVHFGARGRALAQAIERVEWQEFPGVAWNGKLYHRVLQVKPREPEWLERMRVLDRDMGRARLALRGEARVARWNRDEIEYYDHAARRYAYVAQRERLLHELVPDTASVVKVRRSRRSPSLERQLVALRTESGAIREQFEKLWRARYRVGTLRTNLNRLDRQSAALDSIRAVRFPAAIAPAATPVAARGAVKPGRLEAIELAVSLGY